MISIVIPVVRPEKAKNCIEAIKQNAGVTDYEILSEVDENQIGCPEMVKRLVAKSRGEIVVFLGDDTVPKKDFLKNAIDKMASLPDGWGVVGLGDGNNNHAHWMASKKMLPYLEGEFFHTGYHHGYCDDELTDIAAEMGRYTELEGCLFHDHPVNGGEMDEHYTRAYKHEKKRHDLRLYLSRKVERGRPSIAMGFPVVDEKVYLRFMVSFVAMEKPNYTLLIPDYPVGEFPAGIADVRNNLVEQALNERCTHLIMMDTDQLYPPDCVPKLLSHGKPVVGTPVHRRWPPFDPILLRGEPGSFTHVPDAECYSGDLVEVDATGCGCILYDLRTIMDVKYPWFETTKTKDGKTIGEDVGMCAKLRANNVPIYVDTSIEIGHMTTYEIRRETYQLYKKVNGFQYKEAA